MYCSDSQARVGEGLWRSYQEHVRNTSNLAISPPSLFSIQNLLSYGNQKHFICARVTSGYY